MKISFGCVLVALLVIPAAFAEEPMQHHVADVERLGDVTFPISCSPSVQQAFQRGVALLHSFAYEDAATTFKDLEKKDAGCGMAYWGEAMSYYHQIWGDPPDGDHLQKGLEACRKATEAGAKTEREREFIGAIGSFYRDWPHADHATRAATYRSAMERVYNARQRPAGLRVFDVCDPQPVQRTLRRGPRRRAIG